MMRSLLDTLRKLVKSLGKWLHFQFPNEEIGVDYLRRGVTSLKKNLIDLALADANEALRNNPELRDAYLLRALCFQNQHEFHLAIENLTQVITRSSQHAFAYFSRGLCYNHLENHEFALADIDEAIRLTLQHTGHVTSWMSSNDKNEFDETFFNFILEAQNMEVAYFVRANGYVLKEDYEGAFADYTAVIQLNPLSANAYLGRGDIYQDRHDFVHALVEYDMALSITGEFALLLELHQIALDHREQALDALNNQNR